MIILVMSQKSVSGFLKILAEGEKLINKDPNLCVANRQPALRD